MTIHWFLLLHLISATFIASRPKQGYHFIVTLNGKYTNILFDTGCFRSWIFTYHVVPDGFRPTSDVAPYTKTYHYPMGGDFTVTHIARETLQLSPTVSWTAMLPLVTRFDPNGSRPPSGLIGAAPGSNFMRAFPTFTIIPQGSTYQIRIGSIPPTLMNKRVCIRAPIAVFDLAMIRKWLIRGARLGLAGGTSIPAMFEVDTGTTMVTVPVLFWGHMQQMMANAGAQLIHSSPDNQSHDFANCYPNTVPNIVYHLNANKSIALDKNSFAVFNNNGCTLRLTVHQYILPQHTYLGAQVLKSIVTEFSANKKTITFCPIT